jgi:hypothetical protein
MGSRSRTRGATRRLAAALAAASATIAVASSPTLGFVLLGGQWADEDSISYFTEAGGVTATAFVNAKNHWNAATPTITFVSGSEGHEDVTFRAVNNGTVPWDGATNISPNCCSGANYTSAVARLNRFYTDGYVAGARQGVASHEMGHVLGLDHTCDCDRIMNPFTFGTDSREAFGARTPRPDDKNGVNAIY